ncbi:MAG: hypothetical protein GX575_23790 [Candidatus Anammoximicrobium sp.]|nr:hypothetical protein [Candidatus Anammoximicrobium sp.]
MSKRFLQIGLAGVLVSMAALSLAAESEIVWPQEWTVFGPIPSQTAGTALYGRPRKEDLLAGEALKSIPQQLEVGGQTYQGQPLRVEQAVIDLARTLGCGAGGTGAYLLAPLTAPADTTVQIGAGADWWMHWWVDGQPVYDTLGNGHTGNGTTPITGRDHSFTVRLTQGRHVLAVAVFGYRQFLFAVTSPRQMREQPLTFRQTLDAGRRKYLPPHWSIAADFAAARRDFEGALALAATETEQAEARLAVAESFLLDAQNLAEADAPAIRQQCSTVLELKGARAEQQAQAALFAGQAWLLENRGDRARAEFSRAGELGRRPDWKETVQLALARAHAQDKDDAAARAILTQLLAAPSLDRLLRFHARSLLAALEVAPRLRPDHPRLFFHADRWPAVQARIERDGEGLQRLQRLVRGLPDDPEVRDWGAELMRAALVQRVTGEASLLVKIRKLLRATIDHYLLLQDFNSHVETRIGCAAALDWTWNDLPPAERAGLAHDLLRYACGRHVQDALYGAGRVDHDPYYYSGNMHWYVGLTVLDPGLSETDYLRALTVLGRGYDNNVVASFGHRMEMMKDRGGVTRADYNFEDLPTPAWTFLHCWRSAVGTIPGEWEFASGFAPSYALRYMLGFKPGYYRHFGHAHSWRPRDGWQSEHRLYDNLGQFIYFFAKSQPEEAAIAGYLRQQMGKGGSVGTGSYPIYPYVLDLSQAPPPRLPDGLPLARHYPVNGLVLMSSGFDPAATYVLYSCGGGRGEHLDTGHFTIFQRGYLALDSGTRALDEYADPSSGENYDKQSVAHNTVLIRMPGETMKGVTHPTLELQANSGGQRQLPSSARVLAFQSERLFAYAATDARPTYHPDKCAQMVRQFLFLTPDHFVVFDRVTAQRADYPKTWLLHTGNEPAVTGREFRADQEQGRIFCRTLYPPDAVLEKVGGPGKEFWADGRNWPIPVQSPYLRNLGLQDASDVAENMGRWRVEVKPGAARTEDAFLHLIQVSDETVQKMADSQVRETGEQIELTFTVGARTYSVALNRTGDVGGHLRITEDEQALFDQDLTGQVQSQTNLALIK